MSNWREEIKVLPCGCKLGRSGKGPWFLDFICDEHIKEVQDETGHYSYDMAVTFTERLNKEIKIKEALELEKEKEKEKEKSE